MARMNTQARLVHAFAMMCATTSQTVGLYMEPRIKVTEAIDAVRRWSSGLLASEWVERMERGEKFDQETVAAGYGVIAQGLFKMSASATLPFGWASLVTATGWLVRAVQELLDSGSVVRTLRCIVICQRHLALALDSCGHDGQEHVATTMSQHVGKPDPFMLVDLIEEELRNEDPPSTERGADAARAGTPEDPLPSS